ncbi:MAG: hypothetical protein J7M18_08100, partial [Candidatus Eremiobacteraeota bacterium]|nr:hypothetical protein [Candidatus Eremiobacteraeota bacterium]
MPEIKEQDLQPEFRNEIGLGILTGIFWRITGSYKISSFLIFQMFLDIVLICFFFFGVLKLFGRLDIASIGGFLYATLHPAIIMATNYGIYIWAFFLGTAVFSIFAFYFGNGSIKRKLPEWLIYTIVGILT